jgi:hypothetical protein
MAAIDAAFPDPAETCKYLQNDTKRVPRSTATKNCELVCPAASLCFAQQQFCGACFTLVQLHQADEVSEICLL